jgi:S1-C subfamily serine protease
MDAIAKASRAVVRIRTEGAFIGLGVIISNSGRIVAQTDTSYTNSLTASLEGGNTVPLSFISRDTTTGISIFQAEQSSDPKNFRTYTSAIFSSSDSLKLGQSAVIISGRETPVVGTGIISSLIRGPTGNTDPKQSVTRIIVATRDQGFDSGAILVSLLGEVMGIQSGGMTESGFIPSNSIKIYATP